MTDDRDRIEKLPDLFLKSARNLMLRGAMPSRVVEEILLPVLAEFGNRLDLLPLETREDLETILKVYPELADRHGIVLTRSVFYVLDSLMEHFGISGENGEQEGQTGPYRLYPQGLDTWGDLPPAEAGDFLAENQQALAGRPRMEALTGFTAFKTDQGTPVILHVGYEEGRRRMRFAATGLTGKAAVHIGGIRIAGLDPEGDVHVPILEFLDLIAMAPPDRRLDIEIREDEMAPLPSSNG